MIQLNPELLTCTRREFFDALYAENVLAQVHYLPVYWHSYYEKLGYPKGLCPNAEYLYEPCDEHSALLQHDRRGCGKRHHCD